jgi:hypothetical protein
MNEEEHRPTPDDLREAAQANTDACRDLYRMAEEMRWKAWRAQEERQEEQPTA